MNSTLCIPRIENTLSKESIFHIFRKINWGYIENIREVPLVKENNYKRVIIKIRFNKQNAHILQSINDGETLKLVYNDPWYMRVIKFIPSQK